jgi:diguanylate cyclase (GGDEF)-like protein
MALPMKPETNPLSPLRAKIALLVMLGVAALTVFLSHESSQRLTGAYEQTGRDQLTAIATTWDQGFDTRGLAEPGLLQQRVERLKAANETLHKISVSWHDGEGRTRLVQAGHVHDPQGTKRDVTTSRPIVTGPGQSTPIDEASYGYGEVHASDGAHYAELNHPIRRGDGEIVAALELHYDLKALDGALTADQHSLMTRAAIAGSVLALLTIIFLVRSVVRPLDRIRAVTNRIRLGDKGARLAWSRRDEIGDLARDFDRMADELLEALKDPLTGLLNHRAFQERLGEELRRAEREAYPVALIALDIDDFKVVNDAFGHATGDEALRLLTAVIRSELRPFDVCGRVGGDELMIAVVGATCAQAEEVADRLRAGAARIELAGVEQPLTISAGIAGFPEHSLAQEELLHLADGAMYWAKLHGKDRTFVYTDAIGFVLSAEEAAERNLRAGLVNTVHALARAVDAKDGYTHSHSQRVARYAVALAERLGIGGKRLELIRTAGVLHDVGKIGIADRILLKPDRLTADEFAEMKRHSELGRDIIAGAGMEDVADWVCHLHERVDGRGYPAGLGGDAIPLESRLLHCADALEAMTSSRVYRDALPIEVALDEIERGAGTQFDACVARVLVDLVRSGELTVGEPAAEPLSLA